MSLCCQHVIHMPYTLVIIYNIEQSLGLVLDFIIKGIGLSMGFVNNITVVI